MRAGPSIFLSVLVSLSVLGIFTNCVEAQSPCDEACNENIGFPAVGLILPRKVFWSFSDFTPLTTVCGGAQQ